MKKFKPNRISLSNKPPIATVNTVLKRNGNLIFYCSLPFILFVAAILMACNNDDDTTHSEPWEQEVNLLRTSVEPYKDFDVAVANGYDVDLTGYRTQMGHHYIKASNIDDKFDVKNPEALLFVPDSQGKMQLVAVEYATAITDLNNPPPAPEGFSGSADFWEINTEFSIWTLHVWIVMENPYGLFAPRNPMLP